VAYLHTILHRAFKDAVAWDRLVRSPCDAARPPKSAATARPEMRTWTGEQVGTFLARSRGNGDRYYIAWLTLATTGLRRGELLGLRWSDVDLERGTAAVRQTLLAVVIDNKRQVVYGTPKTERGRRSIALDTATVTALKAWRKEQLAERLSFGAGYAEGDLIFCLPDGRPYHPERFSREFDRRVERWDMPRIRLHDLRHTHATLALERRIHPRVVQERLGHANVGITLDTYSHVSPAMDASAAETIAGAIFGGSV
jgi:integrase